MVATRRWAPATSTLACKTASHSSGKAAAMKLRALTSAAAFVVAILALGLACMPAIWQYKWFLSCFFFVLEALVFPLVFAAKFWRLNAQPGPHHAPCNSSYQPRAVFDRFTRDAHKLSKYICIKKMIQTWYHDVPSHLIKRGNVADLLTYGFWFKARKQLEAEGHGHLPDLLVSELEEAWGVQFEEGHSDIPFMTHIWQDIRCHYRPLIFYAGIEFLFLCKHFAMLAAGFSCQSHRGQYYYIHGPLPSSKLDGDVTGRNQDDSAAPFLFLHGVGLGLLPYARFVFNLVATGRTVIAVETPHLGMRWVSNVPSEEAVVDVIVEILGRCNVTSASVVAHSYGTFMSSRLVQRHPELVHSLVLIDPVCFVMFSGKLVTNFVYQPRSSIITWLVARDLHHAASVCRQFYWAQLNLWPDQLPNKTLVVLSGKDELVPVEETLVMLREEAPHVSRALSP